MIEKIYTTLDATEQEKKLTSKLNEVIQNFNELDRIFIEKSLEVKILKDDIKNMQKLLRERQ